MSSLSEKFTIYGSFGSVTFVGPEGEPMRSAGGVMWFEDDNGNIVEAHDAE